MRTPGPDSLTGSARVSWRMVERTTAEPVPCSALRVDSALVSVGRENITVPCGQPQSVAFENLLAGRYPVIIALRTLGTSVAFETRGNVVVEAGAEASAELVFQVDAIASTTGDLVIRWRVNDRPAPDACATLGASTLRVTELSGSIGAARGRAPCEDGSLRLSRLRPGTYGLQLDLLDPHDTLIASNAIPRLVVRASETAMPDEVQFATGPLPSARALATWTVSGTVARAGCARAGADAVLVRALPEGAQVPTFTATAACSAGHLSVDGLGPSVNRSHVTFELYRDLLSTPPNPVVLTSTTITGVRFVRGQTTTISAALIP